MSSGRRRVAWLAALSTAAALVVPFTAVSSASADTAPPVTTPATPATVSADGLPTAQMNGVGWSQVVVGNTVYVGGSFSRARPAGSPLGSNEVTRNNLLAYNITTGALVTTFSHSLNAQALAVAASPDGSTLYVGGDFTTVDGVSRQRLAAFNVATGALITTFAPRLDTGVWSLAATNTQVYVGGRFSSSGSTTRNNAAAFAAGTGALLPWNPNADDDVRALTLSPDGTRVILGGRFTHIGGVGRYGLGAVDTTAGAPTAWTSSPVVMDAGPNSAILSLAHDGTNIYGTGYVYTGGGGNFEGRFAIKPDGSLVWLDDCHGDSYSVFPIGNVLYNVSHSHDCRFIGAFPEVTPRVHHRALADTTFVTHTLLTNNTGSYANFGGKPAPTQLDWYPDLDRGTYTGQNQAAWSVSGNATYVVLAGEFPTVNQAAQQGLVRFAISSVAPNNRGPKVSAAMTPTLTRSGSAVTVKWGTVWDQDNAVLTYRLYRDNGTTPIATTTADSRFWTVPGPTQTFVDHPPNGTHTYKVVVVDAPFDNSRTGGTSASVTITGAGSNSPPTAAFTSSCAALTCSFNAGGSSDSDGSITSYAWTFGDGTTGTGPNPSHAYTTGGARTVTLVVTDNAGGTGSTSRTVAPTTSGGGTVIAADAFNRTVASGLGTADTGGAWTAISATSTLSVSPGAGKLTVDAGATSGAYLGSVSSTNSVVDATFSMNKLALGNGAYFSIAGRRIDATHEYRGLVRVNSAGEVRVALVKLSGSTTETALGSPVVLSGVTYTDGLAFKARLSVVRTGASTMLSLTAWRAGGTQPAAQITTTDSDGALQVAGGVGLRAYASSGATNAPITISVSSFSAAPSA